MDAGRWELEGSLLGADGVRPTWSTEEGMAKALLEPLASVLRCPLAGQPQALVWA